MAKKFKYFIAALFAFGLFLPACSSGGGTSQVHVHTFSSEWSTDNAYHWHKATCEHKEEISDKAAHSFGSPVIDKPATENETGTQHATCSVCGYTVSTIIPILQHTHKASTPVEEDRVEATCTKDGSYDLVTYCSECHEEMSREHKTIPALGHDYHSEETHATYEADGYITYTCSRCGDTYTESNDESQLEHHYAEAWSYDEEKGTHYHACTDEGYETLRGSEATHTYTDVVTPATYEEKGYTTHTCSVCGYSYKDSETAILTHNYSSEWSYDEEKGTHYHVCTDEGYETLRDSEAVHTFNDVVTPATYETKGYTTHTCSVCGYSYKDNETDVLAHHYAEAWSVDKEKGTHYHACTDEGYETLRGSEAAHSYNWIVDKEATVTKDGHRSGTCSVCGHKVEEVLYATGTVDKLYFRESSDNKSYSVEGRSDASEEVVIPAMYQGLPVTSIREEGFYYLYITSVSILGNVTSINERAFVNCKSLTSVTLSDSVATIGDGAFAGCTSLTSINIPFGVTSIGTGAFQNCKSLTSITIPDSVTTIGIGAFQGCTGITNSYVVIASIEVLLNIASDDTISGIVQLNGNVHLINKANNEEITEVLIPDGVASIDLGAFKGCSSITTIHIPASVASIGGYAFNNCTSLTSINFKGTKEQWNAISKGDNWNSNVPAIVVHCSDGDVDL